MGHLKSKVNIQYAVCDAEKVKMCASEGRIQLEKHETKNKNLFTLNAIRQKCLLLLAIITNMYIYLSRKNDIILRRKKLSIFDDIG